MTTSCPHCGGEITVEIRVKPTQSVRQSTSQSVAQSGATQSQNGRVAHDQDLESKPLTKDGRQGYNQGYPDDFLTFWDIYPRHRDKRKALLAWRRAIRRAAIDDINAGATRYRNDPNRDDAFTKYAEGWLNGDGWLDDPLPFRLRPGQPSTPHRHAAELAQIELEDRLHGR